MQTSLEFLKADSYMSEVNLEVLDWGFEFATRDSI